MAKEMVTPRGDVTLHNPPFVHTLFSTTTFAWLWAIVRLYVGYEWVKAGVGKIGNPAWVSTGEALKKFWTSALGTTPDGQPKIAYGWYHDFISYMLAQGWYTWFAKLIAYGELLIGVALILGICVGLVAGLSGFMNWNYVMAGSASTNAMLLTLSVLLVIAWKVAGWYGLDRYILPRIMPARSRLENPHDVPTEPTGRYQPRLRSEEHRR